MAEAAVLPPRLSPFASLVDGFDSDRDAGVILTPRTVEQVQIDCSPMRAGEIGLPLPGPGEAVNHEDLRLLNLAPGRWIVIAAEAVALEERVRAACSGSGAAIVDQGHGRAVLRVSGPRSRDLLAKGTGIDLHARSFAEGRVATTALFHVTVTIDRRRGTGTFDLHLPRGYARTLAERLVEVGRDYGVALGGG